MLLIPDAKTSHPLGVGDAEPRDILDADESNINRRESRAIPEVRLGLFQSFTRLNYFMCVFNHLCTTSACQVRSPFGLSSLFRDIPVIANPPNIYAPLGFPRAKKTVLPGTYNFLTISCLDDLLLFFRETPLRSVVAPRE
jgi:hypothetical protein